MCAILYVYILVYVGLFPMTDIFDRIFVKSTEFSAKESWKTLMKFRAYASVQALQNLQKIASSFTVLMRPLEPVEANWFDYLSREVAASQPETSASKLSIFNSITIKFEGITLQLCASIGAVLRVGRCRVVR